MPLAPTRTSRPSHAGLLAAFVLLALPGLAVAGSGARALRAAAETAVGAPVAIDPRLQVPDCPGGFQFTPAAGARSLHITCPARGWQAVVPIAAAAGRGVPAGTAARQTPAIRRGDMVTVSYDGPGFRVTVEAIAEASAAPGERVMLRNRVTGQRFPATVAEDGTRAFIRR
ncbi:flagella basal body P-ring formation protein FlgA [Thermaurantiacus sp.]